MSKPVKLFEPLTIRGTTLPNRVVVSPHVGDLDSARSQSVFELVINNLKKLYDVNYHSIACDLHPGYASTRWAERQGLALQRIPHHVAHASAIAGEHPDVDDWLVFAWDGVGYGPDGTVWGGEFLVVEGARYERAASLRPFRLPGGEAAIRGPWRTALALMVEASLTSATGAVPTLVRLSMLERSSV